MFSSTSCRCRGDCEQGEQGYEWPELHYQLVVTLEAHDLPWQELLAQYHDISTQILKNHDFTFESYKIATFFEVASNLH
jgi:hypothetical protein